EEIVRQLHIQRQVEANSAAPHIGAPPRDILVILEDHVEAASGGLAGEDRRVLRQAEGGEKVRPLRGGKKFPGGEGKREKGCDEQAQRERNRDPPRSHGEGEEVTIPLQHLSWALRLCGCGWLEDRDTKQRCEQDGHEPRHDERNSNNREQRERVFA